MRTASEHQITQVTGRHANTGLRLVMLPNKEIKKGWINLLLYTDMTFTLIKVGNLKARHLYEKSRWLHRRDSPSSNDNRKSKSDSAFSRQGNTTYHACWER